MSIRKKKITNRGDIGTELPKPYKYTKNPKTDKKQLIRSLSNFTGLLVKLI